MIFDHSTIPHTSRAIILKSVLDDKTLLLNISVGHEDPFLKSLCKYSPNLPLFLDPPKPMDLSSEYMNWSPSPVYLKTSSSSPSWNVNRKFVAWPKNTNFCVHGSEQNPPNTCPSWSRTTKTEFSVSLHWLKKVSNEHPSSSILYNRVQSLVLMYPGNQPIKFDICILLRIPLFHLPLSGTYLSKTFCC